MSLNASFITSIMNVKADIYRQTNTQDPNTGAIVRQWSYLKTVQCKVEPVSVEEHLQKVIVNHFLQQQEIL